MRFRNAVLLCSLAATLALASCSTAPISPIGEKVATNQIFSDGYGPVEDHGYALPAIPINKVNERFPPPDRRLRHG